MLQVHIHAQSGMSRGVLTTLLEAPQHGQFPNLNPSRFRHGCKRKQQEKNTEKVHKKIPKHRYSLCTLFLAGLVFSRNTSLQRGRSTGGAVDPVSESSGASQRMRGVWHR